jgi:hypothetical protein
VYCLRQLGRDTEAEGILVPARIYVDTLQANAPAAACIPC